METLFKRLHVVRNEAGALIDLISRVDLIANSFGMDRAIYFEQMLMPLSEGLARVEDQIEEIEPRSDEFECSILIDDNTEAK